MMAAMFVKQEVVEEEVKRHNYLPKKVPAMPLEQVFRAPRSQGQQR